MYVHVAEGNYKYMHVHISELHMDTPWRRHVINFNSHMLLPTFRCMSRKHMGYDWRTFQALSSIVVSTQCWQHMSSSCWGSLYWGIMDIWGTSPLAFVLGSFETNWMVLAKGWSLV